MSMLQEFYVFLADMFVEGEGQLDPAKVKEQMEEGGFDDVTSYDVREAVNLMYEEGDVFESSQSSVLEAYTGGNQVDQSFNGSNIGVAATTGTATSGSPSNTATSGGGSAAPAPAAPPPPPPPPMDPGEGYAELDAAVQQIVYVSNITNNNTTNNTTNIDDRDTFEDNDTVVDSSVNQTILANGDVNQDFDTTIAGEGGIAVAGDVDDANLVTGDNDGVIADDITDSNVVAGDNFGVSGDVEGSAVVGDGNTTQTATGDGSAIGDGNVTGDDNIVGDGNATGEGAFVGDGNAVGDGAFVGDGNATAEGAISGDGNAVGDGSTVGDGNTQVNVDGTNDGVLNVGDGDVNAIVDSTVGAAGFGSGAVSNTEVTDSYNDNSDNSDNSIDNTDNSDNSVDNTDNSDNSIDNSVDHSIDLDLDLVVVDDSNVTGSDIGVQEVEIAEPIAEPADLMPEGA